MCWNKHNKGEDMDYSNLIEEAIAILSEHLGNVLIPTHLSNYEQD